MGLPQTILACQQEGVWKERSQPADEGNEESSLGALAQRDKQSRRKKGMD